MEARAGQSTCPTSFYSLLLVVYVDEFRVDHVILLLGFAGRSRPGGASRRRAVSAWRLRGRGFVHRLRQLVAGRRQLVGSGVDLFRRAVGHHFLGVFDGGLDVLGLLLAHLVAMLLEGLLDV